MSYRDHQTSYRAIAVTIIAAAVLSGCAAQKPYAKSAEYIIPLDVSSRSRVVVIDPGHGGKALGASSSSGLREKDVVLDVARRLQQILEREGFRAILTRNSDISLSLDKRRTIAISHDADLFISIHCNANNKRHVNGTVVYILSDKTARTIKDLALTSGAYLTGTGIDERAVSYPVRETVVDLAMDGSGRESRVFAEIAETRLSEALETKNLGVKEAAFAVLKNVALPSVLVEMAFISNWKEGKLFRQASFRQKAAEALAGAVRDYFDEL